MAGPPGSNSGSNFLTPIAERMNSCVASTNLGSEQAVTKVWSWSSEKVAWLTNDFSGCAATSRVPDSAATCVVTVSPFEKGPRSFEQGLCGLRC